MKKRYTDEQIIGFLREAERGVKVKDLCRRHGFSEGSFYVWRGKFGGMDVSDAKRQRALETENARLEKLHIRRRRREKIPVADRQPLICPGQANEIWSMDFVFDRTEPLSTAA